MRTFGRFVYGDQGSDLVVRLKHDDGTAHDVSSATDPTLVWRTSDNLTGSVTGTVVAPGTNGQFRFENPGVVVDPGTRLEIPVEFIVTWAEGVETFKSRDIGRYLIVRFP